MGVLYRDFEVGFEMGLQWNQSPAANLPYGLEIVGYLGI